MQDGSLQSRLQGSEVGKPKGRPRQGQEAAGELRVGKRGRRDRHHRRPRKEEPRGATRFTIVGNPVVCVWGGGGPFWVWKIMGRGSLRFRNHQEA